VSYARFPQGRTAPPSRRRGAARLRPRPGSREERRHLGIFAADGSYSYTDFWHFLKVYEAATSVLTTPEDYARLTRAVLAESAAAGVVYSETFLSPDFCGGRDVAAWREYLARHPRGGGGGRAQDGITLRGIVTCIRHFGPEKARETALCAAETAGDWLVGFGIAGDEKAGIPATSPGPSTWRARRGSGSPPMPANGAGPRACATRSRTSAPNASATACARSRILALVDRLAEDGIVLEVCPGSNVTLGIYPG
jgi:adenosine deaminase